MPRFYGLKDAPRAWRLRLHQLLCEFRLRQSIVDGQLYFCTHKTHDRTVAFRDALRTHLEAHLGTLTVERDSFTHTGIHHTLSSNGLMTHQHAYAAQLRPASMEHLRHMNAEDPLSEKDRVVFMSLRQSLLKGVAWLTQSRPDLVVYVRNVLPSARAEESAEPALKGSLTVLIESASLEGLGDKDYKIKAMLLDFVSSKQHRVVRSTYSAEINALSYTTARG
eukprot:6060586-Amphidinium_carterae.3